MKLPKIFRKSYTEKKLEKKIYSKIYIPDDLKYLKSLFSKSEKTNKKSLELFEISLENQKKLTKKDIKRLKLLAKQIKKQKSRIKFLPLAASISFLILISVLFSILKNPLVKLAIEKSGEYIFEAKCNVQAVDLSFRESSLKINKLQVANKKEPMKNLFEVASITLDFDLPRLLKRNFIVDEVSVLEFNTNTERQSSGAISNKKVEKLKKKKEKQKSKNLNEKEIKTAQVFTKAKDGAVTAFENTITNLFRQYNPESLLTDFSSNLRTPNVVTDIQNECTDIVKRWESKPIELEELYKKTEAKIKEIQRMNFEEVKTNPLKIKEYIEIIDSSYKLVQDFQKQAQQIDSDIKKDSNAVKNFSTQIQTSITADKVFVDKEINKIASFVNPKETKLFSILIEGFLTEYLGKYYPYYVQAQNYIEKIQESQKQKSNVDKKSPKKEKKVKQRRARAAGRVVIYNKQTYPSFWIKKIAGSGTGFNLEAYNICNNQNLINKTSQVKFSLTMAGINHNWNGVLDLREQSKAPILLADYNAKDLALNIPSSFFGSYGGTPSFKGKCMVNASFTVPQKGDFLINGKADIKSLQIEAVSFEPEFASKIYQNVLKNINNMNVDFTSSYLNQSMAMNLKTDVDRKILDSMGKEINSQLDGLKKSVKEDLTQKLNAQAAIPKGEIEKFTNIQNQIKKYNVQSKDFEKLLEEKKKEGEKYLNSKIQDATNKAANEALNQLKKLF